MRGRNDTATAIDAGAFAAPSAHAMPMGRIAERLQRCWTEHLTADGLAEQRVWPAGRWCVSEAKERSSLHPALTQGDKTIAQQRTIFLVRKRSLVKYAVAWMARHVRTIALLHWLGSRRLGSRQGGDSLKGCDGQAEARIQSFLSLTVDIVIGDLHEYHLIFLDDG